MSITLTTNNNNQLFNIGKVKSNNDGLEDIGGNMVGVQQVYFGTNVNFSSLSSELPSQHVAGLSDITTVPKEFNWRYDKEKSSYISKPGNQGLCGSCWAISAAGIIGDNFVVSGLNIDDNGNKFIPNISTTWILMNYGQQQCAGGNPGMAFQQIANDNNGVVSNHCIDYSWCSEDSMCNGDSKKHFQANPIQLNGLIPTKSGCYFPGKKFLFKINEQPNSVAIGMKLKNGSTILEKDWDKYKLDIKKHIMAKGPVLGGFLVFNNFMAGTFTKGKSNKGIYLENGTYPVLPGASKSNTNPTDPSNFKGSHAVAIIGWGSEDNVETSPGKKETVEYWYCRNSWTENWGDGGYFKMAMYPHNKISQFDKQVTINSKNEGKKQAGGIVCINITKKPELVEMNQVTLAEGHKENVKLAKDKNYYQGNASSNKAGPAPVNPNPKLNPNNKKHSSIGHTIILVCIIGIVITMISVILLYLSRNEKTKKKHLVLFVAAEIILLAILGVLIYFYKFN